MYMHPNTLDILTLHCLIVGGRYASLNWNIYVTADPTPVDVDHVVHARTVVLGALNINSANHVVMAILKK